MRLFINYCMDNDFSRMNDVKLKARFLEMADWVRAASTWEETQRRMVAGTYPCVEEARRRQKERENV